MDLAELPGFRRGGENSRCYLAAAAMVLAVVTGTAKPANALITGPPSLGRTPLFSGVAAPPNTMSLPTISGPMNAYCSLEAKVRAYERATGNEIAVAVVPSLDGMLVEEYAQGLFRAWGVGKAGVNNGVLFVWAPNERRLRIQVGSGLEGTLTDTRAGLILAQVRDLFRDGWFDKGVITVVDGIIDALGQPPAVSGGAASEQGFAQRQEQEREAARAAATRNRWMAGVAVVGLLMGLYLWLRRRRAARWRQRLPRLLSDADQALAEAELKRRHAQEAYADLRKEAPEEVSQRFEQELEAALDRLARLRGELGELRLLPGTTHRELHTAWIGLIRWQGRVEAKIREFEAVGETLEMFRSRREEAQRMLPEVGQHLTRLEPAASGEFEGVMCAAGQTYKQALAASQERPANWLLVYDLLADVAACLKHIENPAPQIRYRPVRSWYAGVESPAADALETIYTAQAMSASAGGGDSGGFSGGGDSGTFGGGDTGGGGASSDY